MLICPSSSGEAAAPDAGELPAVVEPSRESSAPVRSGADGSSAGSAESAAAPPAECAWGAPSSGEEKCVPVLVPAAKTSMGGGLFNLPCPGRERRRGAQPQGERGGEAEAQKRPLLLREHGSLLLLVD